MLVFVPCTLIFRLGGFFFCDISFCFLAIWVDSFPLSFTTVSNNFCRIGCLSRATLSGRVVYVPRVMPGHHEATAGKTKSDSQHGM